MTAPALDLSGRTSLPELAGILAGAALFIGADSGVMHLAAAAGVPVLAIFGPKNHRAWGPWTPDHTSQIIRSGVLCSPCLYVGDGIGQRDGCPARTCLKLVTPEQVIAAAVGMLEQPRSAGTLVRASAVTDAIYRVPTNDPFPINLSLHFTHAAPARHPRAWRHLRSVVGVDGGAHRGGFARAAGVYG